jgi:hypothetical protein
LTREGQVDDPADSFDASLQELKTSLAETSELLRRYGAPAWAAFLEHCLRGLTRYDAYALDELVGAYGGAGTLNDLVLGAPMPGGGLSAELVAANDQLDALRHQCYCAAQDLRRQLHG